MATVKVTLYNAERNIIVDVDVSAADAQRASTDEVFATQLLNKALNEQPQISASADPADKNVQFTDINEEFLITEDTAYSSSELESNDSTEESDSGCSSKSNKTPMSTLLRKRLKQKEEHEQQKWKRHKERMAMDEKLLNVLEKLANKI